MACNLKLVSERPPSIKKDNEEREKPRKQLIQCHLHHLGAENRSRMVARNLDRLIQHSAAEERAGSHTQGLASIQSKNTTAVKAKETVAFL